MVEFAIRKAAVFAIQCDYEKFTFLGLVDVTKNEIRDLADVVNQLIMQDGVERYGYDSSAISNFVSLMISKGWIKTFSAEKTGIVLLGDSDIEIIID